MINLTLVYLLFNWLLIVGSIYLGSLNPYLYPISFFVIANRQFANYLIGHEGVHGLIVKNKWCNDFISRYFCLFLVYVSFDTYKTYHLSHHEFLGTHLDPDKSLYDFYPVDRKMFFKNLFWYSVTFKMFRDFIVYFTPFYALIKARSLSKLLQSDCLEYLLFNGLILVLLGQSGYLGYYVLYWLIPLILFIPYYYFVSALQHGLIHRAENGINSRNISGHPLVMEIFLPCSTNYHGIHHEYPNIAFYNLRKVYLKKNKPGSSYLKSIQELLPSQRIK